MLSMPSIRGVSAMICSAFSFSSWPCSSVTVIERIIGLQRSFDQHGNDARGHEVCHCACKHGAEAELGEFVAAMRDERSDAPDLHADGAEVGEAAEREGCNGESARRQGAFLQSELGVGDELVDHGAGAEEIADLARFMPWNADKPRDRGADDSEYVVE